MRRTLLSLTFCVGLASSAFAANSSVPNMTAGSAISDTDLLYCAQSAGTTDRKCTGAQIKTYANTSAVDARTTTTEAIATTDQNKLVTFNNAAPVASSIDQATSGTFFSGWVTSLKNLGAGTVTLTATTSTIDGSSTLTLTTGQGVDLYSDGANYFTQPGKGGGGASPGGSSGQIQTNNGSGSFNGGNLSGGCSTNNSLVTACASVQPSYVVGNWYFPDGPKTTASGNPALANKINCLWTHVPVKLTISNVGAHIQTVGTTNFQMALYDASAPGGFPGSLLSSTGNILDTATGPITGALAASVQVGPGSTAGDKIWFCSNQNDSAVVYSVPSDATLGFAVGSSSASNLWNANTASSVSIGLQCSGAACNGGSSTFNTWPASLVGTTWTYQTTGNTGIDSPFPFFMVGSVP